MKPVSCISRKRKAGKKEGLGKATAVSVASETIDE